MTKLIKNYTTEVRVATTIQEIQQMLAQNGARGIAVEYDLVRQTWISSSKFCSRRKNFLSDFQQSHTWCMRPSMEIQKPSRITPPAMDIYVNPDVHMTAAYATSPTSENPPNTTSSIT